MKDNHENFHAARETYLKGGLNFYKNDFLVLTWYSFEMEDRLQKLETELEVIKQRNLKVEADKAWEISIFRKITIAVITYIVASTVLYFIGVSNYLLSALIPTLGFLLSTLSLKFIKSWWVNKYKNRR